MQPLLPWKSYKYYTFWVHVFCLIYQACTTLCHIILSSAAFLALQHFPTYLTNGTIFGKNVLNKKYVLIFCITFVWNNSHYKKIQGDVIINVIYFNLKCPLFLSVANQIWIISVDFQDILKYKMSWKSVQWEQSCSILTDRHDVVSC